MPAAVSAGELRGFWQRGVNAEMDTPLLWGYEPILEVINRPDVYLEEKHMSVQRHEGPDTYGVRHAVRRALREEVPCRL